MNGLTASIFEDKRIGNCSNGGISSRCTQVTVVELGKDSEVFEASDDAPAVRLVRRIIGGKLCVHAEPVDPVPEGHAGWMMGGSYISTSDGRFAEAIGFYGAVALHDRSEPWAMYEQLTR